MRCSLFIVVASALYASASIQSPPRISKQPPTDELLFQVALPNQNENDKPFLIECEAEGEPAPTYRWIKNGKPFEWSKDEKRIDQQQGRGTLVISRPQDEDLGQYQCFAENEWGIATSNSVFVRKAELNSFKDEDPMPLTAKEGEPFKLTCQPPGGWPKPNVYWLIQDTTGIIKSINNSRMTLDPEGTLWFSNVTQADASDDYYYACAASSIYRKEYKVGNRFLLKVIPEKPSATPKTIAPKAQYLSNSKQVALRGKKVELFCIFGGTPLPETVWMKDGVQIKPNDRVTHGNYGKSLVIKHVNFNDQGKYTCEATNGVGKSGSHEIKLKVEAVPYFTVEPEIQTAAEDETVEFKCEATGVPAPFIKWVHNGKPLSEAPPNPRRKLIGSNRMIIERLTKKDTGNYGCNATNSLGYVYKDVYVNVLALEPEITEPPKNEATVEGTTIKITCHVFGAPKPRISWMKSGQQLSDRRFIVSETGTLEIRNVTNGDAGTYTCHAVNKFGQAEASANLIVKEHTRITDTPVSVEVAAGGTATFKCNAVADSSLTLEIDWLRNEEVIDTENEPRFIVNSDSTLTITKTALTDHGTYSCVARTELDERRVNATLTVQDVPNSPVLTSTQCYPKEAKISWRPTGDNRAPILHYIMQYNTSFTPDTWETAQNNIQTSILTQTIALSPWANYTFRVIAWNKIGGSIPSVHSQVCTSPADVPYKNPSDVVGKGTTPTNLVISWTTMTQIEHNGNKFMYRVSYRRDIPGQNWTQVDITNWRTNRYEIENQPTYQRYQIKVEALNEVGQCREAPKIIIGYSGEDQPTMAPENFTVAEVKSSTTALLSWSRVPLESVRGELRGYKVQTWTEKDEEDMREITVEGADATRAAIDKFVPYRKNYVRMFVFNGMFNGPPSETLSFDTPEGVPGTVLSLEAWPMGSSAMALKWTKPTQPNGNLTGYRIYFEAINGSEVGPLVERQPHISYAETNTARIKNLKENTMYRVHIKATTRAGEGSDFYVEQSTKVSKKPDVPSFRYETIPKENGEANVKVIWEPERTEYPGSYFYVNWKGPNHGEVEKTQMQYLSNEIEIPGLRSGEVYEMQVVAVDGMYKTESDWQTVETSVEGPIIQPKENVATAGWFIGMMLAIAFLLMVLIIVCVIKRNRGGKYAVHERELAAGRGDYGDEGGFHEYSQPLDSKSVGGRASVASSSHHDGKHPESDTDSMAEYGEGDTEGMNEDGSFIGQYGRQKKVEPNSQFATLV